MSAANLTYGRRRMSRVEAAKAAKARRQKIFVVAGAVAFLLLLLIQVPRTLRMLSSEKSSPTATEAAPAATAASGSSVPGRLSGERLRRFLAQFEPKDPFVQRSIRANAAVPVRPPKPGETDPFEPRSHIVAANGPIRGEVVAARVSAPAPARTARAKGKRAAAKRATPAAARYTIVLASIPVYSGRLAAVGTAARARGQGLSGVGVLRSSEYPLLRPGYNVVHGRIFATRSAAERALAYARKTGYRTAYIRRLR